MARPRGGDENPVSLFPFLSILACVIGTLVLMITSLAISQMESDPEEELLARVEEYREIEKEQQEIDKTLETMLPKLLDLEKLKEVLRQKEEEAARLRKLQKSTLEKNKDAQDELKKLLEEEKKLKELIEKLKKRQADLDRTLEELRAELERRRRVHDAPTVTIMPAEGERKGAPSADPVFVEADAKGLILDPGGKRDVVPTGKIRQDPRYKAVLDDITREQDKVLVILVRAKGISAYSTAEHFARTQGVTVAKLPIVGDGKLDLSRF
jgi:hypothetical protein